jgi:hypothetical protein
MAKYDMYHHNFNRVYIRIKLQLLINELFSGFDNFFVKKNREMCK